MKPMSDDELEAHIKHCGHLMELEMDRGNRESALNWLQAMQEAIKARSPAQVQRMEQELMQRIHEPCYFTTKGDEDRIWLLERQAA